MQVLCPLAHIIQLILFYLNRQLHIDFGVDVLRISLQYAYFIPEIALI